MGNPAYTPDPEIPEALPEPAQNLPLEQPPAEVVLALPAPERQVPFHEREDLSPRTRRIVFSYEPPLNEAELQQHYRHVRFFEFGEPPPRWNIPVPPSQALQATLEALNLPPPEIPREQEEAVIGALQNLLDHLYPPSP